MITAVHELATLLDMAAGLGDDEGMAALAAEQQDIIEYLAARATERRWRA